MGPYKSNFDLQDIWQWCSFAMDRTCYLSSKFDIRGWKREHNRQQWMETRLYLAPWVSFHLREFKFYVIRVYAFDFFPCRVPRICSKEEASVHEKREEYKGTNALCQQWAQRQEMCGRCITLIISTSPLRSHQGTKAWQGTDKYKYPMTKYVYRKWNICKYMRKPLEIWVEQIGET